MRSLSVLARLLVVLGLVAGAGLIGLTPASAADSSGDPAYDLAQKYAPYVVVREQASACGEGEPFLPTPVTTVLGKNDVVLRGPDGQEINAPTAADLAGKGEGWYLDYPGNPLSPGCDYEQWFDKNAQSVSPAVYARIAKDPDHPDQLALQYWFFWTYNDWNDKHEGDWEMIQLLFDATTPEQALTVAPQSTAYAQHEGSEVSSWTDTKLHKVGDHVVVYPGQGSHAAYYTQARWFGKSAAAGFGCDNTTAPAVLVQPDVIQLPALVTPDTAWITFTGRWGQKAPSFNNGPTGPSTKTQWTHPVAWQIEEGRPDGVSLPAVMGPAASTFCSVSEAGSLLFIQVLDSPTETIVVVLALLALIVLLVLRTDWRHSEPLRPDRERRAGQMAAASLGLVVRKPLLLLLPALLVAATEIVTFGLDRWLLRYRPTEDVTDVNGLAEQIGGLLPAVLLALFLIPVAAVALTATIRILDDFAHGRELDQWREVENSVRRPAAVVVMILLYFVWTFGSSSWWTLVIALVALGFWAVAVPVAALEGLRPVAALRRSAALTKRRRLRSALIAAFLFWIAFSLPSLVGAVLLLFVDWPFWVSNLITVVLSALFIPAMGVGLALLFYDLRRRQETPAEPEPVAIDA
jgi:hypothetical protein